MAHPQQPWHNSQNVTPPLSPHTLQPIQHPQQQYVNNAPVSPVSPYVQTQPHYQPGHGTLTHTAPMPHNPTLHNSMPQMHQYMPVYSNVPGQMHAGMYPSTYGTQPQAPGQMMYTGPNGTANVPGGQGYGLRHTIPSSQPVYRPGK